MPLKCSMVNFGNSMPPSLCREADVPPAFLIGQIIQRPLGLLLSVPAPRGSSAYQIPRRLNRQGIPGSIALLSPACVIGHIGDFTGRRRVNVCFAYFRACATIKVRFYPLPLRAIASNRAAFCAAIMPYPLSWRPLRPTSHISPLPVIPQAAQ